VFAGGFADKTFASYKYPKDLPVSHCVTLKHLHGIKLWKHYIYDIDPREAGRIYATIYGESRWQPREINSIGAAGLVQFMPGWYHGVWWPWRFNPFDPIKSIQFMVYNLRHASRYGGWNNWAGH